MTARTSTPVPDVSLSFCGDDLGRFLLRRASARNTSTRLQGWPTPSLVHAVRRLAVEGSYDCERRLALVYYSRRMGRRPARLTLMRYLLRVIAVAAPAVCATFSSPQTET